MKHVVIYKDANRYAGWPANYGMWNWNNEIALSFVSGYPDPTGKFHAIDNSKSLETIQARSTDGGLTWSYQPFPGHTPGGRALSADEHMIPSLKSKTAIDAGDAPTMFNGDVDLTDPNITWMNARTDLNEGSLSWFYISKDKCHQWEGPYQLPDFNQIGISARTDCIVNGPKDMHMFLTATKSNGKEGRVFCARTTDAGQTFEFLSWVGDEPEGYAIMPSSIRLANGHLLCAVRYSGTNESNERHCWIDLFESKDDGKSWSLKVRPVENTGKGGNPPTLNQLSDDRLVMVYGFRDHPCGIRAKISQDSGSTWGEEIILRDDAGSHDIGYPRTVVLPDDTIVTAYYYNDGLGAACYIACTIWKP